MAPPFKPRLFIVAGPNGAGKSTFSKDFSNGTPVLYDPDKEAQRISEKFQGFPAESIHYHIDQHFMDLTASAWTRGRDFVLETNFRDYQLMETVEQFRQRGYELNLAYLLLKDVDESEARVFSRVDQGGHFVDHDSIVLNYREGLSNFCYFCDRFDNILLFNSSGRAGKLDLLVKFSFKASKCLLSLKTSITFVFKKSSFLHCLPISKGVDAFPSL